MPRNRNDDKEFLKLADKYRIPVSEVKRIVFSFFDILQSEAKELPFDTDTKIFSRGRFNELVSVYQIPFIGRIGPVYSRYLLWRKNESDFKVQKYKEVFKKESSRQRAERIARKLLSGETVTDCSKKEIRKGIKYKRVWMVGIDGRRLASQVLPIEEK